MKKIILILLTAIIANAQSTKIGIKGGVAYDFNGTLKEAPAGLATIYKNEGKDQVGWHAGVFTRIQFATLYLQPELVYTNFKKEYVDQSNTSFSMETRKIDVPLAVGLKLFKIARIQAGPILSYYLKDNVTLSEIKELKRDDFSVGGQAGVGADFGKISLDARYEYGLNESESSFVKNNTTFKVQNRPTLITISIGYNF